MRYSPEISYQEEAANQYQYDQYPSQPMLSSFDFHQPEFDDTIFCGERSPLGLTLNKTPSFLNLLEMKLSRPPSQKHNTDDDRRRSPSPPQPIEKLKASNFPASLLQIGSWERVSRHQGDLVTKLYYAKRKLVWEVLEGALKRKIEVQWSDIAAITAIINDNEHGILKIELNQPPLFFQETNPQPRKHTLWQQASDFTGGQASICRMHSVVFPPGILDKHYEKLLQCDQGLFSLSRKPFPSQEHPYFHSYVNEFSNFSNDINGCSTELFAERNFSVQSFTTPNFPPQDLNNFNQTSVAYLDNFEQTSFPHLSIINSNSPMSDERVNWCANEDQSAIGWPGDQRNPIPYCQDYDILMKSGELSTMYNPIRGLQLDDFEKHLFGDPQVVCLDQTSLLAEVTSSLLRTQQEDQANLERIYPQYFGC